MKANVQRQYQSFGDTKGGSNSALKLECLKLKRLGPDLRGKSVLDLGCNEGFFSGVALERGAKRVVGVDRAPGFLERARTRFPQAEFIKGTWWNLPREQFDLVLFLSAVHYETNQRALFDHLLNHLKPDGTLILECGVAPNDAATAWIEIYRASDPTPRRYPTLDYLTNHLMPNYVVSVVGQSVMQKGDPIPRWVFHCKKRRPMAMIVTGAPGDGKSLLAKELQSGATPVYRTDGLFRRLFRVPLYDKTPLANTLRAAIDHTAKKARIVSKGTEMVVADPTLLEQFVGIVCNEAALDAPLSIIEGEIFQRPAAMAALTRELEKRGVVVWQATRQRQGQ
jgi:SAM-dependent methyltransferase